MAILSDRVVEKYSQTPGQRTEIDTIMAPALLAQSLFGQQILDPAWTLKRHALGQIISVLILIYVIWDTLNFLKNTTDPNLKAEGYFTFIIIASFLIKCPLSFINRTSMQKLYVIAKTILFDLIKENDEKTQVLLKSYKKLVIFLFSMTIIPYLTYILPTVYYYVVGSRVCLSRVSSMLLPMTSPYYELSFFLYAIHYFEIAFILLANDMWFVFFTYSYCIACDRLVEILEVKSEDEIELDDALRKFYVAHVKQMEYLNTVSDVYKWQSMVPLCTVLACLCLMMLQISEGLDSNVASNMLPILAELFAYNWFGELVKTKAENVASALLEFNWIHLRVKDRKSYLIIICYANKEFGIKTAFGNQLSMLTMSSILKASYETYAVMRSMQN